MAKYIVEVETDNVDDFMVVMQVCEDPARGFRIIKAMRAIDEAKKKDVVRTRRYRFEGSIKAFYNAVPANEDINIKRARDIAKSIGFSSESGGWYVNALYHLKKLTKHRNLGAREVLYRRAT